MGNWKDSDGFKTTKDGSGYTIAKTGDGHVHDTFKVDNNGNITDYHTTVQIKGGKKINIRP